MLLKYRGAFYRTASKLVVYHGTGARYLRSILKHGLQADPPERQYTEQDQHTQTYGGVYFTPHLHEALKYVDHATQHLYQDDGLLILCRIETRTESIVPDEDVFLKLSDPIKFKIQQDVGDKFNWPNAQPVDILSVVHDGRYDLDRWVEPWLDNIIRWVQEFGAQKLLLDKSLLLRHREELAEILRLLLAHEAASRQQHRDEYHLEILRELGVGTTAEARQDFVDAVTELSRRVQRLTDPQANLSLRSLGNVGYAGANRIVGILRFSQQDASLRGEVMWNRDPELIRQTIQQMYPGIDSRVWTQAGDVIWETGQQRAAAPSVWYREADISAQSTADKILFWWDNRGTYERGQANWKRRWDAYNALQDFLGRAAEINLGDRIVAYRATNRKEEPTEVRKGVEILSRNHATDELEKGMSVAPGLEYAGTTDLKWVYQVEGTVVDFGSDGEPVLTDVKVVGPIETTDRAVARDWKTGEAAQRKQKKETLLRLTGLDPYVLFILDDKNWFRR